MSAAGGRRPRRKGAKKATGRGSAAWLAGLTAVVALLAATGGALGYLGARHWTLDALAHPRLQYTIVLLVCSGIFLALRRLPAAGLSLAAAVLAGAPLVAHRLVDDVRCPLLDPDLRVLALTLPRPLASGGSEVVATIRERAADVVFLTGVEEAAAEALDDALSDLYPSRTWEPRPDRHGVGLLTRLPASETGVVFLATSLPSVVARVEAGGSGWTVVGTHAPSPFGAEGASRRDLQLEALAAQARGSLEPTVVVGTFGTTPWAPSFQALLASSGLADGGAGGLDLGGWGPSPLLRLPVDHTLVSPEACVVERSSGPDVGADHLPLYLSVALR